MEGLRPRPPEFVDLLAESLDFSISVEVGLIQPQSPGVSHQPGLLALLFRLLFVHKISKYLLLGQRTLL
jgi:hypothetical protein